MIYLIQNTCSNAGTLKYLENENPWVFPNKFLKTWTQVEETMIPVGILSTALTNRKESKIQ